MRKITVLALLIVFGVAVAAEAGPIKKVLKFFGKAVAGRCGK